MSKIIKSRSGLMKQREGERLYRSLRRLFARKFQFEWTDEETSYTNGKTIWIKYNIQTERNRTFTEPEIRALREAHGLHEAGHVEFDYLPDYTQWLKENSSTNRSDWLANKKYPLGWLQLFGNMGLDGRMERLLCLKLPSKKPLIDFSNAEWRFSVRHPLQAQDRIDDFRHCYSSRVLGMEDRKDWHEEAVELASTIQSHIDEIRLAPSTKAGLEAISSAMERVWPTLYQWMEEEGSDPESINNDIQTESESSHWSDSSEEASERSLTVIVNGNTKNSTQTLEDTLKQLEKQCAKDSEEVEQLMNEISHKIVSVDFNGQGEGLSAPVTLMEHPSPSSSNYNGLFASVKPHIKPIARELKALLDGEFENPRRNTRSGKLMAGQVWKATKCNDSHVFRSNSKGTPSTGAFIGTMMDVSGSTYVELDNGVQIIEEMKQGLCLLLEAATSAGVPSQAFAFTETESTLIYRIKPDPLAFTAANKAALGGLYPDSGNRDTCALKFLIDQVEVRHETIKIAIMLSDGLPIFEAKEGPETIHEMVKQAEKKGIEVLCLFIGKHSEETLSLVRDMYPGRVINAEKGIARELQKQVKRIIRQRR